MILASDLGKVSGWGLGRERRGGKGALGERCAPVIGDE